MSFHQSHLSMSEFHRGTATSGPRQTAPPNTGVRFPVLEEHEPSEVELWSTTLTEEVCCSAPVSHQPAPDAENARMSSAVASKHRSSMVDEFVCQMSKHPAVPAVHQNAPFPTRGTSQLLTVAALRLAPINDIAVSTEGDRRLVSPRHPSTPGIVPNNSAYSNEAL